MVVNESVRNKNGCSTSKDVSNLGDVAYFNKSTVSNVIDNLIRLFEIEEYGVTDQEEILQSREYGDVFSDDHSGKRLNLRKTIVT